MEIIVLIYFFIYFLFLLHEGKELCAYYNGTKPRDLIKYQILTGKLGSEYNAKVMYNGKSVIVRLFEEYDTKNITRYNLTDVEAQQLNITHEGLIPCTIEYLNDKSHMVDYLIFFIPFFGIIFLFILF